MCYNSSVNLFSSFLGQEPGIRGLRLLLIIRLQPREPCRVTVSESRVVSIASDASPWYNGQTCAHRRGRTPVVKEERE